ncbi:MAG TPA: hypothetical protein VF204_07890 [Streptosporangiaceae bacterium]
MVHPVLTAIPAARRFLEALRLGALDPVAEVLASVLPRYAADRGLTVDGLDEAQHLADVEQVAEALVTAAPAARQELAGQLAVTGFLAGENAATGEQRLMTPGQLFLRTPGTEAYLAGNPDAWFARDRYGPWRAQLQELGVRDTVPARSRPPGPDGNVLVAMEFARNERGLHGFDPEASIEGLGFALGHPDHRRSEYVWNELLVPNRNLLAGTVERSARLGFADADRAEVRSAIGAAAAAAAWLPGPDGAFHRPDELQLDDLPPAFKRDDQVAAALGMIAPVVAEASRQLGLPPGLLRGLAAHPDLVALVERELAAREAGTSHPGRDPWSGGESGTGESGTGESGAGESGTGAGPDPWALLSETPEGVRHGESPGDPGIAASPDPWSLLREPPERDGPGAGSGEPGSAARPSSLELPGPLPEGNRPPGGRPGEPGAPAGSAPWVLFRTPPEDDRPGEDGPGGGPPGGAPGYGGSGDDDPAGPGSGGWDTAGGAS